MQPKILKNFPRTNQAQDNWCWAAATACIFNYYKRLEDPKWAPVPQCAFVRDEMQPPKPGCRNIPPPGTNGIYPPADKCLRKKCFNPATSVPEHLDIELDAYGLLDCSVAFDGTTQYFKHDSEHKTLYGGFDWDEIRTNIDEGRPLALRVLVSRPGQALISHFLVVIGYHPLPADKIVIWDPYPDYGEQHVTLEELTTLYGPLEDRYLTRPPPERDRARMPPLPHPRTRQSSYRVLPALDEPDGPSRS